MALLKDEENEGPRYFIVARGTPATATEPAVAPAVIAFDDATDEERAQYRADVVRVQATNKGAFLDAAHRAKTAAVLAEFIAARIKSVSGFEVEERAGDGTMVRRELVWPQDKAKIFAVIPRGKLDLFRRMVEQLNFPSSTDMFDNAAIHASRDFPN